MIWIALKLFYFCFSNVKKQIDNKVRETLLSIFFLINWIINEGISQWFFLEKKNESGEKRLFNVKM